MRRIIVFSFVVMLFSLCAKGRENNDSVYTAGLLQAGEQAPDFIIANGDTLVGKSLSSFRGRYVVLDFWASWCRDCRKDIPAVKRMHDKYASADVAFIGVSFDTNKDAWQKCIRDNNMSWIHHSELKQWKSTGISEDYHIKWIPTMYLLDREGRVLFATIHAEEMEQFMSLLTSFDVMGLRYPGGSKAAKKYVNGHLQYPDLAKELQAEGQVVMHFTLNPDGSVSDITATDCKITHYNKVCLEKYSAEKREMLYKECARDFAKEGYRVIKSMDKWKKDVGGKPVKVDFKISFGTF